jgi:hypothetical protein
LRLLHRELEPILRRVVGGTAADPPPFC